MSKCSLYTGNMHLKHRFSNFSQAWFSNKHFNLWEKLWFLGKARVNFVKFQNKLLCIHSGLKLSFCENLNTIGPVAFALAFGPHTTIYMQRRAFFPLLGSRDLKKSISVENSSLVFYLRLYFTYTCIGEKVVGRGVTKEGYGGGGPLNNLAEP